MTEYPINQTFYPVLNGAPEGLVGTLEYGIKRPNNTIVQALSIYDIVEIQDGSYRASRPAPAVAGTYLHVWYDELNDVGVTEVFEVAAYGLGGAGLTYANLNEFRAIATDYSALSDDVVIVALREAEKDIDSIFLGRRINTETGRRFTIANLSVWQIGVLRDATIAQAVFRTEKGTAWFEEFGTVIHGPDFTIDRTKGQGASRIGTGTMHTLRLGGLIPRGGRARA